jgi:hypothetical protein
MTRHYLPASLWKQNPDDDTLRWIITLHLGSRQQASNHTQEGTGRPPGFLFGAIEPSCIWTVAMITYQA